MPVTRSALAAQLKRARILALAATVVVTAGLTAAVSAVIPGRSSTPVRAVDPFTEPLTAFPPAGTSGSLGVAPQPTTAAPVAVSGAS